MSAGSSPRPAIVWRTCATAEVPSSDVLTAGLGATERRRAEGISAVAARQRYVTTRLLLHRVVRSFPSAPMAGLDIGSTPTGRPVARTLDLELSVAHTRGLAAAACSTCGPVGIDVEPLGRTDLPPTRAWLTPSEAEHVRALTPDAREARRLSLWVGKEAALKACDRLGPVGRRGIEVVPALVPAPPPDGHDPTPDAELVGQSRALVAVATGPSPVSRALLWYEVAGGFLVALAHPS